MQVLDVWVEGRKDGWHYLQVGFKVKAEAASLFVGVQMKQKGLLMYALNDSLREFCFDQLCHFRRVSCVLGIV
jgi:hypothetical protein